MKIRNATSPPTSAHSNNPRDVENPVTAITNTEMMRAMLPQMPSMPSERFAQFIMYVITTMAIG